MTREQMIDLIIETLGHEHNATIWFIQFCEDNPNADNNKLYELLAATLDLVRLANKVEGE
jgi:hypothetical protein